MPHESNWLNVIEVSLATSKFSAATLFSKSSTSKLASTQGSAIVLSYSISDHVRAISPGLFPKANSKALFIMTSIYNDFTLRTYDDGYLPFA